MRPLPRPLRHLLLSLLAVMSACSRPGPEVVPGVSLALAEHRAAILSDVSYRLRLAIPPDPSAAIDGRIQIAFNLADDSRPLQLDFRAAPDAVHSAAANGAPSDYRLENEHIVIPPAALEPGRNEIEIAFAAGSGALNRSPDFLYTLFVPDRARTAFPLFDQPDLKARYELTLNVPRGWQALSNAPVAAVVEGASSTEYRFERSDLISSYLFAFVAGEFETVTRELGGRSMTLLHRETDTAKVERNIDAIFELHAAALDWLESYTGIDYPFGKFDFALIPDFQYNGMEHVGSILYRARSLFLEEFPSDTELLGRASVIAHETAHMWFGNLVTMRWFNDVWTKEVFANFMAAKIVNPSFPAIDHDLHFAVDHYPSAYAVDRSAGATPIRQQLANLNEAGQMYGPIIYDKAPIMMRQLETLIGEERFAAGMREYLRRFSHANATWPELIEILDGLTDEDLAAWSRVWVETAGRPAIDVGIDAADSAARIVVQHDPAGRGRVWPQRFEIMLSAPAGIERERVASTAASTRLQLPWDEAGRALFNADGFGYGLFPADIGNLEDWDALAEVAKASELINLYENLLEHGRPDAQQYFQALQQIVAAESNQLVLQLALDQLRRIYWNLLTAESRSSFTAALEQSLRQSMLNASDNSIRKIYFDALTSIATTADQLQEIYDIWAGTLSIEGLPLSENDRIDLAQTLAIKLPDRADDIVAGQLARTENPDNRRRLEFVAPSLSADAAVRDAFFASLADERRREVERWVLDALGNLHHPLRTGHSEQYLLPSLELLEEIQVTGDIFFPANWLNASLRNHGSANAVAVVERFLAERPDYNERLRMLILQAADFMFRANAARDRRGGSGED